MVDEKKYPLCACLTENNINKCLSEIKKIKTPIIEHRIDYLEKVEKLEELYKNKDFEFIATCRREGFGGYFKGSEEERIGVLLGAIEEGATFVDIEVETEKKLIDIVVNKAREKNCKVIISMHDFDKTPPFKTLLGNIIKERSYGADIGKVVCTARTIEDCHNLLDLIIEAHKLDFPIISFGMGDTGKFTRVSCLFYGAIFSFVSNNKASAPGQLTYDEMVKAIELMK
jgi:3-dehydroquinate dehydratase-1